MEQYIKKSAVVAEIERNKKHWTKIESVSMETENMYSANNYQGRIDMCNIFLSYIDTIEVKEVDLDFQRFAKEMDAIFALPSSETENTEEKPLNWEYAIAKHFFELGMAVSNKAQEGEEI